MVDNLHNPPGKISYIKSVNLHADAVGRQCAALAELHDIDKRWLAIAITQLQQGFMALIRSIDKPDTF
jgi:hypothetical protein